MMTAARWLVGGVMLGVVLFVVCWFFAALLLVLDDAERRWDESHGEDRTDYLRHADRD